MCIRDRFPSGQWGQTVNLLLFSFGGSNPPAPTKRSSIRTGYWIFCFVDFSQGWAGGFEQHRPAVQSGGQKSPSGAFLDARLAQSTRAHPSDSSRVQTHRGCFIFVCAWCSSMQHILEVEKNGAFVTNLSQKGYKPTFSTQKDCETIVYLVSYRGGWQIVPVCEKK